MGKGWELSSSVDGTITIQSGVYFPTMKEVLVLQAYLKYWLNPDYPVWSLLSYRFTLNSD
jgi:hypothetical protein